MNKHASILNLMIRSSFSKILGVIAVMAGIQGVMFLQAAGRLEVFDYGLEQAFSGGHIAAICGIGFVAVTVLLCRTGCDQGGKSSYTWQRLSVSEQQVFLWQAFYNTGCYFLFWCMQTLIALGLCWLYVQMADPVMVTSQTIALGFYRSHFLYNLLPMEEIRRWIRNFLLLLCLGLTSAAYPYQQRRGKFGSPVVFQGIWTILFFCRDTGDSNADLWLGILSGIVVAWSLALILRKGSSDEE